VHEDSGVFLRSSRGQRREPRCGGQGKFAGILQGEIRQRVSSVCMLKIIVCEGIRRSRLARALGHKRQAKQQHKLSFAHRSNRRGAYGGLTQRFLEWPMP
jgi:hypothetical protein